MISAIHQRDGSCAENRLYMVSGPPGLDSWVRFSVFPGDAGHHYSWVKNKSTGWTSYFCPCYKNDADFQWASIQVINCNQSSQRIPQKHNVLLSKTPQRWSCCIENKTFKCLLLSFNCCICETGKNCTATAGQSIFILCVTFFNT